ncbi:MAG: hypothetical protein Q4C96_06345 [Planctomycetia bacterium]|nr:hypothetical protein [Planctomycetia bacterium]
MADSSTSQKSALGFLTVIQDATKGLFGGYLILNPAGRPVEFHCTAPVRPNRAQQILYGPTLEPFLYGEQIAKTLIEKSKIMPRAICVDLPSIMCVRNLFSLPILLVCEKSGTTQGKDTSPQAFSKEPEATETEFLWNHHLLRAAHNKPEDIQAMQKCLEDLLIDFDLQEPFQRIREAISEAQKAC